MSAAFLKWYLATLKSHPLVANMSTAVVLMSAGDAMAQGIEQSRRPFQFENETDESPKVTAAQVNNKKPLSVSAVVNKDSGACSNTSLRSFALNRHATLSPNLEVANCDYGISRLEWESPTAANVLDATTPDTWQGLPLDGVRTGTMAFWAGAIQAPFFLVLYRFYDRILPTAVTPYAVGSRVALSFVSTIPFTAAFFAYGAFVNHFLRHDQETSTELSLHDDEKDGEEVFWMAVADKIQEKWSQDLGSTLQTSATVWVPFNALNFSLVPPHVRPLCMMTMSAGWNCYLSLVQYKES